MLSASYIPDTEHTAATVSQRPTWQSISDEIKYANFFHFSIEDTKEAHEGRTKVRLTTGHEDTEVSRSTALLFL
jgi:hypothetical protein